MLLFGYCYHYCCLISARFAAFHRPAFMLLACLRRRLIPLSVSLRFSPFLSVSLRFSLSAFLPFSAGRRCHQTSQSFSLFLFLSFISSIPLI